MKRLLTLVAFFATLQASAQQVNPVPDYVFRNQMSVGRNAVTDTAAYFSIGPRYGATKGFMPPIVGDTATFSSGKRNGLLIFSVQKNKFLYWDSVRVQWSDMAGSSGSYIVAGDTAAMLAPYLRKVDTTAMLSPYYRSATASAALALKLNISDTSSMLGNYIRHAGYGLTKSGQSFLVDTLNIATRAWRQKGLDSLAALEVSGSGTTNYVAKFTAGSTIGNSQIFDNGTSIGINTSSPASRLHAFGTSGATTIIAEGATNNTAYGRLEMRGRPQSANHSTGYIVAASTEGGQAATNIGAIDFAMSGAGGNAHYMAFSTHNGTSLAERLRIFANGRVFVGASPTDAGYQLDVNGTFRTTSSTDLASSGGEVRIAMADAGAYTLQAGGPVYFSNAANTSLTTAAGLNYMAKGDNTYFTGFNFQGVAASDMFFGRTASSDDLVISTSNTGSPAERVRFRQNGDVGIGTNSPAYKLDINGTLRSVNGANFATTSGGVAIGTTTTSGKLNILGDNDQININTTGTWSAIYFKNAGSDRAAFYVNNTAAYIEGRGSSGLYLGGAGATAHVNLNSNGELIIGTGAADAGDYKLQVSGNIYNTGSAVLAATSGNVGIGTTSPTATASKAINIFGASAELHFTNSASGTTGTDGLTLLYSASDAYFFNYESGFISFGTANTERGRINSAGEWIIDASGTDAGDYKLQVVGNARIGTGKLDIASNTTFGIGVARSGTSEVAGQIYNSSGILYLGAESSAGGQIFSGSSAYAGVIGTGANYPLQFAVNNITRGGFSTSGNLLLGFTTDSYFLKLQVNGSIFSNNQFFGQGANAQLSIDSSTNISPLYVSAHSLTGTSAQAMLYSNTTWNTTGNPSLLDLNVTNTASGATSNYIKITDGTNTFRVTKAAEVVTAAPTGGSIRKWKLGEAATVSPTSPNRTIRVEIDGTVYYLHAKTTND